MGTGSDLRIFHNGSNSYVQDNGTGVLIVQGSSGVHIKGRDATDMIRANEGSSVQLYHNNIQKLATTSTGVDVTGTVTATSYAGDGAALTGMKLSSASFKNTTGGQSVNGTTFVTLTDWADDGVDAVQYSATTGVVTLTRAGTFLVSVTVAAETLLPTLNYRWQGEVQLWKNGTTDVATTSGGYIRANNGANYTGITFTKVLTFAASDTLAIRVRRISNTTGDATTTPGQCHLSFVEL
jgi:hypothetical protein